MMMMMATWQTTLHWMYKRLALYLANLTHADHGIVLSQLIFLICLSWPSYHCFHSQCLYVDTIILHQDSTFFLYSLTFCNISANQCCQSFIKVNYAKCKCHTIHSFLREYWCLWALVKHKISSHQIVWVIIGPGNN